VHKIIENNYIEAVNEYPEHILENSIKSYTNNSIKPLVKKEETTITETKLFANYPNPFNPSTIIKYQLSEASQVSLKVYDVMGRKITTLVNRFQDKGSYYITFNASGLADGVYFYRLNTNGTEHISRMLLMK